MGVIEGESSRERVRPLARWLGVSRLVRGALKRLGYDFVRRGYYSPLPDPDEIPPEVWTQESEMRGLSFDPDASMEFVRAELAPFLSEYDPPRSQPADPGVFYLDNGMYESVDAETLYAMVRRFSPRRIIEFGSGMSTLVIAHASARNSVPARHFIYDPFPRADLLATFKRVGELRQRSAADADPDELAGLEAGDILFVDTTHTVKIGGEVNRIILDFLPTLQPGVLVHFHDIFLPWPYPQERLFYLWTEQYLLQAFLAMNEGFEILFGNHDLQRRSPEAVAELVPSTRPESRPSAFWLRRTRAA